MPAAISSLRLPPSSVATNRSGPNVTVATSTRYATNTRYTHTGRERGGRATSGVESPASAGPSLGERSFMLSPPKGLLCRKQRGMSHAEAASDLAQEFAVGVGSSRAPGVCRVARNPAAETQEHRHRVLVRRDRLAE